MEVEISLDNFNACYSVGETITGNVLINSKERFMETHNIIVSLIGSTTVKSNKQNPPAITYHKFYEKTISLGQNEKVIQGSNNVFPIKFPLEKGSGKDCTFFESYHGVVISLTYEMIAEVKSMRGIFNSKKKKITILVPGMGIKDEFQKKKVPYHFRITPDKVEQLKITPEQMPKFDIEYHVDSINCDINKGFHGYCNIHECSMVIKSLELQFLRHEIVYLPGIGKLEESSEIQNLQIGDGDVNRNIEIPLFMLFPRVFSCASLDTKDYKINFEMNIMIVLSNGYVIADNFPINTWRSSIKNI